jgi:hypothetical protein
MPATKPWFVFPIEPGHRGEGGDAAAGGAPGFGDGAHRGGLPSASRADADHKAARVGGEAEHGSPEPTRSVVQGCDLAG